MSHYHSDITPYVIQARGQDEYEWETIEHHRALATLEVALRFYRESKPSRDYRAVLLLTSVFDPFEPCPV